MQSVTDVSRLDLAAVFDAVPTSYAVLDTDLRFVVVNQAFLESSGRSRGDLIGRRVFDVFPDNPDDPEAHATANLEASLRRVLRTGRPDTMPLQKYDVAGPDGVFRPFWWSPVNAPVLDEDGRVVLLLHRAEDVTAYVTERQAQRFDAGVGLYDVPEDRHRAEADLYVRGQELRAALTAEAVLAQRLAGVVQVALQLSAAQTVAELTDIVVGRGLGVLGAGGGAVAVRTEAGDALELTLTASLGERARGAFGRVPLDSPLPVAVAAATGEVVVLPDRAAALAFTPHMEAAVTSTGLGTWVSLPLQAAGRSLGALTIGWRDPQDFTDRDLELMSAFAAQCAQSLAAVQAHEQERRVAGEQRRLSETLQRSLLTAPFEPDHLQIAVRYLPAAADAKIGGDWYDCFLAPSGTTTLVVGDVAGHDRDAAAAMAQLRNLLRGVSMTLGEPPAAVLAGLDRAAHHLGVGVIATAVVAQVEQTPAERAAGLRTLRWSNAGHPPPVLIGADGTARLLHTPPDLLLGLLPDAARTDHTVTLEPGATVVLYTDGLVERRGAPLPDGLEWLRTTLEQLHHLSAEELCDALLARLDGAAEDDIALLVLRAHPEDGPRPAEAGPQVLPPTSPGAAPPLTRP
ncbi:PAS domain S-box-containing protein [Kineococcus radiotolerans]|uniref:PAS domain S-box-containing protein n=1 Tax=Kineococcus radiotolerans TaxID=131568 RepID=A0A7W4XWJ7_KINRA|nr:SpoIIE family protein phosphatase [Kineococcus radiotolerans]MBB2900933.1 PAS domain S-box-containing protein [Kineococcus radiotolerans]